MKPIKMTLLRFKSNERERTTTTLKQVKSIVVTCIAYISNINSY